ncbi:MAG: UDP-N-acetylmuramoyl-L-alanine--D-glutamate ligase [Burkholderiales bacterium]|nr:MAG: UDP-N-acetylmuramoyl-L-alanine--D-glutamate ligase [Burkholderiales bacterium]
MNLRDRDVLVLGLGATGLSAARWLTRRGARVTVADTREAPPGADALAQACPRARLRRGAFTPETFAAQELIVISPGVPKDQPSIREAVAQGTTLLGDVELFARHLPADQKLLAITGSNGKSTVTDLTGKLCQAAGLSTVVAGNIGLPVLDALTSAEDAPEFPQVFVLELSSFQLETTHTLAATAATVLNISEDHLDRYPGMAEYAAAKARIFSGRGVQLLNRDDPTTLAMARPGRPVWTFGSNPPADESEWGLSNEADAWLQHGARRILPQTALRLLGRHNALNALAALALVSALGGDQAALAPTLAAYEGLAHRVERVAEKRGVWYVDDSKGTNVGATVAALAGLGRPALLIVGGEGKGQDFAPLAEPVDRCCRAVFTIGRDAPLIERALAGSHRPIERCNSLEAAVARAASLAQPGDAVLLSPACASFDMFRDYAHRSAVFVAAVHALPGGANDV